MPDAQTRHTRGLTVVIILGVIFFALLALLILRSAKHNDVPPPASETLSVLSLRLRMRTQPTANAHVRTFWEPNEVWTKFIQDCRAMDFGAG